MTESEQRQSTSSTPKKASKSLSLMLLLKGRGSLLPSGDVKCGAFLLQKDTLKRTTKGLRLSAECLSCGKSSVKWIHNMASGRSLNCPCFRPGGYNDPRAKMLSARYQAMVQRCHKDTHVSSKIYKGRGICVKMGVREFVTWALDKWPTETFKGKDFDREDNNGHYEISNLRLVSRTTNLLNTRRSLKSIRLEARKLMSEHPEITY